VVLWGAWLRPPSAPKVADLPSSAVVVSPQRGRLQEGQVPIVRALNGGSVLGYGPFLFERVNTHASGTRIEATIDPATERLLMTPTALQWRRPHGHHPSAMVRWFSERLPDGSISRPTQHTFYTTDHGRLPVLSLTAHPGAWTDADTGLLVVGHGMLNAPDRIADTYANDPRWWKYPGNFHGRGKEWERSGHLELMDPDGHLLLEAPVGLRINGQMTRGFPQHALRLIFRDPITVPLFADEDGRGSKALVLRPAGNDQVKAMMRDAYQHRLCTGLPFETSRALTCVVYLNGAYWGVHHLRQRLDEHEIARRHGISSKKVVLLEDRARPVHGDTADALDFMRLVVRTEKWDGRSTAWTDTLQARMDVDGFLAYMASQMILGNMDWPRQNVKWWRYSGRSKKQPPLDGRWYFIMGDTDLSFGANAPVTVDLFAQVGLANAPVSRLFMAMYRNPGYAHRFHEQVRALLDAPLSATKCEAVLQAMVDLLAPEMDRHTSRWRKPIDRAAWEREVDVMRNYAQGREQACRAQLEKLLKEPIEQ
jgi:hypothetical protein